MPDCVIYARVSTKEQQDEGYSIPAQLKAMRVFCTQQDLNPIREFREAESAGHSGRKEFGAMLEYLRANPEVRVVVAHKLDRLYRNFSDQIALEEDLGIRARYVVGDMPEGPQGELLRDVQLAVAKHYLGNLRQEVIKGMDEKVAQGGWPHKAPVGYLNDKNTHSLVVDPIMAPVVRYAFERYATGTVSISQLAEELAERGLTARSGGPRSAGAVHKLLRNPIYTGKLRYKGQLYPGAHQPLISEELFASVQHVFEPKRHGIKKTKHTFALRDWLSCAECGCKITAERQRGHVYYRCTHWKDECTQNRYTREEQLFAEVEQVLKRIEITPDILAALVEDCRALDEEAERNFDGEREGLSRQIEALSVKASRLLDSYLDGVVPVDVYQIKAKEIESRRVTLEHKRDGLVANEFDKTAQVEVLAREAVGVSGRFIKADTEGKRRLMSLLLSNIDLRDGHVASYQYKRPFQVLEQDPKGAFYQPWWALEDLNL